MQHLPSPINIYSKPESSLSMKLASFLDQADNAKRPSRKTNGTSIGCYAPKPLPFTKLQEKAIFPQTPQQCEVSQLLHMPHKGQEYTSYPGL